jgi:hypothetical protein
VVSLRQGLHEEMLALGQFPDDFSFTSQVYGGAATSNDYRMKDNNKIITVMNNKRRLD